MNIVFVLVVIVDVIDVLFDVLNTLNELVVVFGNDLDFVIIMINVFVGK